MFSFDYNVDWTGLATAFLYMLTLCGSMVSFSHMYRKRKAMESASLAPWFEQHLQREVYSSLLELRASEEAKVPDSIIRAALMRRAVADIERIMQIRQAKQALATLLQRGSVGEDLHTRFQRAEKEVEEEIRDVVQEANALAANWGQIIFQSANEIFNNTMLRDKLADIQSHTESEKQWWENRRAEISSDFMQELDAEQRQHQPNGSRVVSASKSSSHALASAEDSIEANSNPNTNHSTPTKTNKVTSDDDSVRIGSAPSTPSGGKKKKGKK